MPNDPQMGMMNVSPQITQMEKIYEDDEYKSADYTDGKDVWG